MIKGFLKKHHRILFYTCWLLINLIQAAFTELFDDEAYYWMYTQFPAWGYFDHPPMIAWLIQTGHAISNDELGVRLLIVLMNTGTLLLIEQLLHKKHPLLFYAICASMAIVQIGGIIAVPDLPLLFFAALFFNCYRQFLKKMSARNTLVFGTVIALMLYSKYHGVLIILFTLLSNFSLLRTGKVYLAGAFALLLFFPHLYWQYQHDFPSVQFHLFERNAASYKISYTLDYLGGQLLLAGPVIGWLLIWASLKHKPINKTERALKFTMTGFYVFFLLSTMKGRVEANWTVPAMIGIIVLSHQYLIGRPVLKWVYNTVPLTLLLVFCVRAYMMLDLPKNSRIKKDEFHNNKAVVQYFLEQSSGKPVVYINSYQQSSKLWFYSGRLSFSLNTPAYRRNNYNYWPIEDSLFGKSVLVTGKFDTTILKHRVKLPGFDSAGMCVIDQYYSFSKVQLKNIKVFNHISSVPIRFSISAPQHYLRLFQTYPADTAHIQLAVYKKDSILYYPSSFLIRSVATPVSTANAIFKTTLPSGRYKARLAISSAVHGHPSLNSLSFELKIQ
jgi:hypothetical protein